jgi:hypothetical protein
MLWDSEMENIVRNNFKKNLSIALVVLSIVSANAAFAADAYQGAFQANTSSLWNFSPSTGGSSWNLGMMNGTSPSIAALSKGGYQNAFQANTGSLWSVGGAGNVNTSQGMMGSTSPAIAASPKGGYQIAFQANNGSLYTYTSPGGPANWSLGMMAGTSPAITALPGGGYQIAFQANSTSLWSVGAAGNIDAKLGMMPGTSPSIAASPKGGYQIAFQANTSSLWKFENGIGTDLRLGLRSGTSPSIAALTGGGYQIAFQANTSNLWVTGAAGTADTGLGMMAGTSPAITALANGSYQVLFQANTGEMWRYSPSTGIAPVGLGMMKGTSPAVAALTTTTGTPSSLPVAAVDEVEAYCKTLGGNDLEQENLGPYPISGYEGFPTTLFRYTMTDGNGTKKVGTVVMMNPSRRQLARWIVQAVIDAKGSYNFANAKTLALYTQAASGFQFPVRGVHWEDMSGNGVHVAYPFRDGVTVQMARFGASYPTRVLTSADLDYIITAPESEVTLTATYARIQSTTRQEYINAGGTDATAGHAWRTAVRNAYKAAWGNDRNLLMTAKAKSLL